MRLPSFVTFASSLGLLLGVSAVTRPLAAQCGPTECSAQIGVQANVIARIDIARVRDLEFGNVFIGTPAAVRFEDATSGLLKVTGEPGFQMQYRWADAPAYLTLDGGNAAEPASQLPLELGLCLSDTPDTQACGSGFDVVPGTPGETDPVTFAPATGGSELGEHYLFVRGRVNPRAGTRLGYYSGSFTVTASYVGL